MKLIFALTGSIKDEQGGAERKTGEKGSERERRERVPLLQARR